MRNTVDAHVTPGDGSWAPGATPSSVGAVNDLEGALLFAGIPIVTVGLVWALVFLSSRPATTKSAEDDGTGS